MITENSGQRPGKGRNEEGWRPSPGNEGGRHVRSEALVLCLGGSYASS